jgi:hypothetical protein
MPLEWPRENSIWQFEPTGQRYRVLPTKDGKVHLWAPSCTTRYLTLEQFHQHCTHLKG